MAGKLYIEEDDGEYAYDISWWRDVADDREEAVIVELQKTDFGGEMWCQKGAEFVTKNESCGKRCPNYAPCNGKRGRCRHLKNGLVGTGIKYIVPPGNGERTRLKEV